MIKINNKQEFEDVLKQPGFKVIKFGAVWCSPCRTWTNKLKIFDKSSNIPIYDVDVDQCRDICDMYNIDGIPVIFVFKNDEVEQRFSGTWLQDDIIENIFIQYERWGMTEDEFNRLFNASTDALTDVELKTFDIECSKRKIQNPHKK